MRSNVAALDGYGRGTCLRGLCTVHILRQPQRTRAYGISRDFAQGTCGNLWKFTATHRYASDGTIEVNRAKEMMDLLMSTVDNNKARSGRGADLFIGPKPRRRIWGWPHLRRD